MHPNTSTHKLTQIHTHSHTHIHKQDGPKRRKQKDYLKYAIIVDMPVEGDRK